MLISLAKNVAAALFLMFVAVLVIGFFL